ncbi:MAG TPA: hypothetical protein VFW92_11055 [Candidatus Limnocylindrales bacterium]|nr:hypothetical protein [Candidatus Limnocylindrales bacterium]
MRDGLPWAIGASLAALLLLVPVVAVLALGVIAFDVPLFTFITAEDSVLEWPQFFALLVAAALFVAIARQSRAAGLRWWVVGGLFAALLACFVAGEEISWGQRILGLATPAGLAAINHQDELTIHNIGTVQTLFGYAEMLVGLVGCLLPIGAWAWARAGRRPLLPALLVPPLALVTVFALPAGYRLVRILFLPDTQFRIVKFGELPELSLYLGVAIMAGLIYRRMRSDPGAAILAAQPGG